jgi:hypothetical protein
MLAISDGNQFAQRHDESRDTITPMSTYGYAVEKIGEALQELAASEGTLSKRLRKAANLFAFAPSHDLPATEKEKLDKLHDDLSPGKSFDELSSQEMGRLINRMIALYATLLRKQHEPLPKIESYYADHRHLRLFVFGFGINWQSAVYDLEQHGWVSQAGWEHTTTDAAEQEALKEASGVLKEPVSNVTWYGPT